MSIAKVNPTGWAEGEKLTAAQMNTLDTNVSTATQDAQRHGARYTISGTVADGSKYTLALVERSDTGYVLASDEVEVPEAGWYRVSVMSAPTNADTSNPLLISFKVKTSSGTTILAARATRFSATAGHFVGLSGSAVFQITTPSSSKISVQEASGAGNGTAGNADDSQLSIERIA